MGIADASESSLLYFLSPQLCHQTVRKIHLLAPKKSDTNKQGLFLVYVFIKLCGCDQQCEDRDRT